MREPDSSLVRKAKEDYYRHLSQMNPGGLGDECYRACAAYYEREIKSLLPSDRSVPILEIGPGFGHLLRYFHELDFTSITGVELDPMLFVAATNYLEGAGVSLVNQDAMAFLPEHKGAFGLVVLFDVIEHFPLDNAMRLMEGVYSAVRPDGIVILRTPNMANLLGTYSRFMDVTHQTGFTEFSMFQLLRQAGFREMGVQLPDAPKSWRGRLNHYINRLLHRSLYKLNDRVMPTCFDKNIVVWARKGA